MLSAAPAVGLAALKNVDLEEIKKSKHQTRKQKSRDADAERFAKHTRTFWSVIESAIWISELHPICACNMGDPESKPKKRTIIATEFVVDVWKVTRPFVKSKAHFVAFMKLLRYGQSQDSAELAVHQGHLIDCIGKAYRDADLHKYFRD